MARRKKYAIGITAAIAAIVLSGPARADLVDHYEYEFEDIGADSAGGDTSERIEVPQANASAPARAISRWPSGSSATRTTLATLDDDTGAWLEVRSDLTPVVEPSDLERTRGTM